MTIVVDASVAINFTVAEEGTAAALDLIASGEEIVTPELVLIEAANAYWAMVRSSRLLMIHAERHIDELPLLFDRLRPSAPLVPQALNLAFRLRHPVYDCIYMILAAQLDCALLTADRKFYRKAAEVYPGRVRVPDMGS